MVEDTAIRGSMNTHFCGLDEIADPESSKHFNGDAAQGGYATYHRSPSHFVVKIPDGVESSQAAPVSACPFYTLLFNSRVPLHNFWPTADAFGRLAAGIVHV